jgi:hypothetical protein
MPSKSTEAVRLLEIAVTEVARLLVALDRFAELYGTTSTLLFLRPDDWEIRRTVDGLPSLRDGLLARVARLAAEAGSDSDG